MRGWAGGFPDDPHRGWETVVLSGREQHGPQELCGLVRITKGATVDDWRPWSSACLSALL